jgi:hypothetical protein
MREQKLRRLCRTRLTRLSAMGVRDMGDEIKAAGMKEAEKGEAEMTEAARVRVAGIGIATNNWQNLLRLHARLFVESFNPQVGLIIGVMA